jgi:SPP1 family predicted phage head-tail adaptor
MARSNNAIASGERRVRLVLEAPLESATALGGASLAWTPVITLWARLEATTGRETLEGLRAEGRTDTRITLRHRAGIDTRMRFRFGARLFAIRAAFDPDGSRRDLVCLCQEISP